VREGESERKMERDRERKRQPARGIYIERERPTVERCILELPAAFIQ